MTSVVRITLQAGLLVASGWLVKEPGSVPVWQIGFALMLFASAVFWMWLHDR